MKKLLDDTFEAEDGRWRVQSWLDHPYTDKKIIERIVRIERADRPKKRGLAAFSHTKTIRLTKRKFLRGVVRDPEAPELDEHIEVAMKEAREKLENLRERKKRTLEDVGVDTSELSETEK